MRVGLSWDVDHYGDAGSAWSEIIQEAEQGA